MQVRHTSSPHLLEGDASTRKETDNGSPNLVHDRKWAHTQQCRQTNSLEQVDVYLDDLIYTCQGGRSEKT